MSTIIFKRLFEVRILHDYFLTTEDGVSFFERNKLSKENLLSKKLVSAIYDVQDLFEIDSLKSTERTISEYKLIFKKTNLGFLVGLEVKIEDKAGEIGYIPRFKMDRSIHLTFSIKSRTPFFKSLTSTALKSNIPSIYYFTNKDKEVFNDADHTSLPLSSKVDVHQDGNTYEMGTLANFEGEMREALQYTDGIDPSHWEKTTDWRFVNNADSILLPHKFNYQLSKEENVTQIEFTLKDESDNEVKKISKSGLDIIESIELDFNKNDVSIAIESKLYTLSVSKNAGAEVLQKIYLNSDIYDKNYLGVVDIRLDELNSAYSLFDTEGFLNRSPDPITLKDTHPIFELRFKNRRTYWRYHKEIDFTIDEKSTTNEFLNEFSSITLVSILPKALTENLIPFRKTIPPNPQQELMLPPPKVVSIKIEKEKIFSEIYINQSNRLIKN
jgi:hypothetical protein